MMNIFNTLLQKQSPLKIYKITSSNKNKNCVFAFYLIVRNYCVRNIVRKLI